MSGLHPSAVITLDGRAFSAAEAALVGLRVDLSLGDAHDGAELLFSWLSPRTDLQPEGEVGIELGSDGSSTPVLNGLVAAVDRRPEGYLVSVLATPSRLTRLRAGRTYLQQSAADIVQDLLSSAEVAAGEIRSSLNLAAYHIDEGRTAWRHLRRLAELAACETSTAADGGLNFRPPKSGPAADHRLRYGADLLDWQLGPRAEGQAPAVVPHGAGSEAGGEKWYLLLGDPTGGEPQEPTRVVPALRDQEAAAVLAEGLRNRARRRSRGGTAMVVGNPAIRAGDLVELADMPNDEDELLRVVAVRHRLDGRLGFSTDLRLEAVP
jgi:hypothetical protein